MDQAFKDIKIEDVIKRMDQAFKDIKIEDVIKRTAMFAEDNGYNKTVKKPKAAEKKYSPTAKRVMKVLEKGTFGYNQSSVVELCEALIGSKLPSYKPEGEDETAVDFIRKAAIVPLKNNNGHSYEIGEVCIIDTASDRVAFRKDGSRGNHLPRERHCVRPATLAEIKEFFAERVK